MTVPPIPGWRHGCSRRASVTFLVLFATVAVVLGFCWLLGLLIRSAGSGTPITWRQVVVAAAVRHCRRARRLHGPVAQARPSDTSQQQQRAAARWAQDFVLDRDDVGRHVHDLQGLSDQLEQLGSDAWPTISRRARATL